MFWHTFMRDFYGHCYIFMKDFGRGGTSIYANSPRTATIIVCPGAIVIGFCLGVAVILFLAIGYCLGMSIYSIEMTGYCHGMAGYCLMEISIPS